MQLAIVISELLKFSIQPFLFLAVYFYLIITGAAFAPNWTLALLPLYILTTAGLGLRFGMLISSMTTKYRDAALDELDSWLADFKVIAMIALSDHPQWTAKLGLAVMR